MTMRCLLSFSLALASAVASLCQTVSVEAQEAFPADKLILATNRARSSGTQTTAAFKARETGPLTFFLVEPVALSTTIRTPPLARESLSQRLAEKSASGEVLVYVHGFNNTVDGAIALAVEVAGKMKFRGSVAVFSWPSVGRYYPWDYLSDVRAAAKSVDAMADLLKSLEASQSVSRVHVLAHSLGNDLIVAAVPDPDHRVVVETRSTHHHGALRGCVLRGIENEVGDDLLDAHGIGVENQRPFRYGHRQGVLARIDE